MDLEEAQKKYPEFVYERFEWKIKNRDLIADFRFRMGEIVFNPAIAVKNIDPARIDIIGADAIDNFVFHLGLAEIPSYWKTACPPKIVVNAGCLDKDQIKFWQGLFLNGMGQFFYENKLPFLKPKFQILAKMPKKNPRLVLKPADTLLIPMGGGKDSLVTLELARAAGKKIILFAFNPNEPLKKVCAAANCPSVIVERKIDPGLVKMARSGFFNGHTPFSALLAFHSIVAAALFDCGAAAISQESSSDEGNVAYLGKAVNHQYSKSFDFENKFRAHSKKYLARGIDYFSALRPLREIQIAKIFSGYPRYFSCFLSCNKPFTLAGRAKEDFGWCGKCPKCLSVFAMLYPFIDKSAVIEIFGKNLFEDQSLAPLAADLLGESACKPFECVGTFFETRAAFFLSLEKAAGECEKLPVLLEIFKNDHLPKYKNLEKDSKKILNYWNGRNNLPKDLAAALKSMAVDKSV